MVNLARLAVGLTAPLSVALLSVGCAGAPPELSSRLIEGTPMYDILPLDGIPAVDDPVHVDAETAAAFMQPDEPVLGFIGADGTAVAYSAWYLEQHEIVNDVVDGAPIAATW